MCKSHLLWPTGVNQSLAKTKEKFWLSWRDLYFCFGLDWEQNNSIPLDESVTTPDSSHGGREESRKETPFLPSRAHLLSPRSLHLADRFKVACVLLLAWRSFRSWVNGSAETRANSRTQSAIEWQDSRNTLLKVTANTLFSSPFFKVCKSFNS